MRKRFKRNMIASGSNYHVSKKSYILYLRAVHEKNTQFLKEIAECKQVKTDNLVAFEMDLVRSIRNFKSLKKNEKNNNINNPFA